MNVAELIPVLQVAVGPVVLVSGVGLLILSLTNRLGRVIDRGRSLASELREAPEHKHPNITKQLKILSYRAILLQRAIVFEVICVLFAAALIITLFFTAAFRLETSWFIGILFAGAMVSLVLSVIFFLQELSLALKAFRLDIEQ